MDKRKQRKNHRKSAKNLLCGGGFFNGYSAIGSSFWFVAMWHLKKARNLKR